MKQINYIILVLLASMTFSSCENLQGENPIPNMRVDLTINILQDAPTLDIQGGYFEITKPFKYGQYLGYGGIVVFHTFDDNFVAFDLSCPNEAEMDVRVVTNMAGQAICPECKTVFDVGFGSGYPTSGVAQYPLRQYRVFPSGYNMLHVTN